VAAAIDDAERARRRQVAGEADAAGAEMHRSASSTMRGPRSTSLRPGRRMQLQELFGRVARRSLSSRPKVHSKTVDLGPRIVLDAGGASSAPAASASPATWRATTRSASSIAAATSTLAAYPGRRFDNNYTLNTADICPVGALTSKDFRFQMRVLVFEGDPGPLRELRHRLQHRHRVARGENLPLRPRGRSGELLLDVRRRPFELQMDWPRRPASQMPDAGARRARWPTLRGREC